MLSKLDPTPFTGRSLLAGSKTKRTRTINTFNICSSVFLYCHPNKMDLEYYGYRVTHLQLTKWCKGIINQWSWTILMLRRSSSILIISELASMKSSCKKSLGTMTLVDSVNTISLFELHIFPHKKVSNFHYDAGKMTS